MTAPRRADVLAAAGLALVVLGFFWRWLAAPAHTLYSPWSDVVVQFSGWKAFMAQTAAAGHGIAWWNPTYLCGTVAYGNPQYLWFHPLHVLFHVLPVEQAVAPTFVLYLVLIGWGTYVWLRLCGLDALSAVVGALAGMIAPRLLYHVAGGFMAYLLGVTALPWAFAAVEYACRRPSAWRWGLVAFVLALMVSSGFVQIWLYGGYALLLYVILRPRDGWTPAAADDSAPGDARPTATGRVGRMAALAGAYAGSLVLAAYHFWPAYVFAQQTTRGGALSLERVTDISITGWHWLTALVPQPWGDPSHMLAASEGRWLLWEQSVAFGVVPLLLLFTGRRSAHRPLWSLGILLLGVCLAFAWGADNPVFPALYHLPGIARFRFPVRFLFIAGMAVAALTATAAAVWSRSDEADRTRLRSDGTGASRPRPWGWLLCAGLLVPLALFVRVQGQHARTLDTAYLGFAWAIGAALVIAAVAGIARRGSDARGVPLAFALLIILDSARSAGWAVQMEPPAAVYPRNAAILAVQHPTGAGRVADLSGAIHKGMPGRTGIRIPDGYDPLQLAHTVRYMRALTGDRSQGRGNDIRLTPIEAPHLFNLLGASRVLDTQQRMPAWRPRQAWEGLQTFQFWQGIGQIPKTVTLYDNPDAFPRAFVVGPARFVALADEEEALRGFVPTDEVLLADPPPFAGTASFVVATISAYKPNAVTVQVVSDGPGYLVLTDAWYPAWRATRNGEPAPVLRADGMFRAVPLPAAGEWTVKFWYAPTAEAAGAGVTGLGLLVLGVLGVGAWRRR